MFLQFCPASESSVIQTNLYWYHNQSSLYKDRQLVPLTLQTLNKKNLMSWVIHMNANEDDMVEFVQFHTN